MKTKLIGFPIKDGCHVEGSDKGIDIIKKHVNIDKIITIEPNNLDIDTVIINDLKLAKEVDKTQKDGYLPITIGGDHSLAIGSISGSSTNNGNLGVIWFDTHPDMNTNLTTVTYNIHGYPLAALMGFGLDSLVNLYEKKTKIDYKNVVLFGINDIDPPEQELIDRCNIKTFTLDYINKNGIDKSIKEAIDYLNERVNKIHFSFDIDSINTTECPGVNVPNRWGRGFKKKDAIKAFEEFITKLNIVSMDIVEFNPLEDKDNKSLNIVLEAIELIKKYF
ncbi:MAG: arginase [Bacilli bacterium]|nr:arginase [Bacilli bacterium]